MEQYARAYWPKNTPRVLVTTPPRAGVSTVKRAASTASDRRQKVLPHKVLQGVMPSATRR